MTIKESAPVNNFPSPPSLSANSLLNEFLAVIAKTFEAHAVTYFHISSEHSDAQLISYNCKSKSVDPESIICQGKGLVGWIVKNKEPLLYHVVETDLPNLGYYLDETEDNIRSFVGVPVADNGALCLDSLTPQFFTENNRELLANYAKLIPQIIEISDQVKHCNEAEKYFLLFEQLADLKKNYVGWSTYLKKFLQCLSLGTGFEYMAFASLSENSGQYLVEGEYPALLKEKEFSLSNGIVGWVLKKDMHVHADGKNSGTTPLFGNSKDIPKFVAYACLPVQIENNTVAALIFASSKATELSHEFKLFSRLVSEDIAGFLETVSLRYRVQKQ